MLLAGKLGKLDLSLRLTGMQALSFMEILLEMLISVTSLKIYLDKLGPDINTTRVVMDVPHIKLGDEILTPKCLSTLKTPTEVLPGVSP